MSSDVDGMQPVAESERRRRTRERLMDAAFEVFAEVGVHSASVEAICERAGFSRGAFYSNFESKEELFFALFDRELQSALGRASEGAEEIFRTPGVPPRHSREYLGMLVRAMMDIVGGGDNWHRIVVEFRLLAMRDEAIARRYVEFDDGLNEQVADLLRALSHSSGIRFVGEPRVISRTLVSLFNAAAGDSLLLREQGATDPDRLSFTVLVEYVYLVTEEVAAPE